MKLNAETDSAAEMYCIRYLHIGGMIGRNTGTSTVQITTRNVAQWLTLIRIINVANIVSSYNKTQRDALFLKFI